jgi:hypothetical protein
LSYLTTYFRRSSPDLNLSLYLWVLVLSFGLGCAASRRSAGESASRSGAAKRRNGGSGPPLAGRGRRGIISITMSGSMLPKRLPPIENLDRQ